MDFSLPAAEPGPTLRRTGRLPPWIQVSFFSKHLAWPAPRLVLPKTGRPQNVVANPLPSTIFGIKLVARGAAPGCAPISIEWGSGAVFELGATFKFLLPQACGSGREGRTCDKSLNNLGLVADKKIMLLNKI